MEKKVTKFIASQLSGIILVHGKQYKITDGIFIAENDEDVKALKAADGYGKAYRLVEEINMQKLKQEQSYKEEAKQLEELGIIQSDMINDIITLPEEAKETIRQNIADIIKQWKPNEINDDTGNESSQGLPPVSYPTPELPPKEKKNINEALGKSYGMMTVGELREMCDMKGIIYPDTANKSTLIKLLEKNKE